MNTILLNGSSLFKSLSQLEVTYIGESNFLYCFWPCSAIYCQTGFPSQRFCSRTSFISDNCKYFALDLESIIDKCAYRSITDGKCYKSLDLLLALDVSGSIEPESWQSEINLSKEIIRSLAIRDSGNRFAVMDFSTEPNVSYNQFLAQISQVKFGSRRFLEKKT